MALHLKEGDEIAYQIEGDRVVLTRASKDAADDPFAAFSEWNSDADRPVRERGPAVITVSARAAWSSVGDDDHEPRGWEGDVVVSNREASGLPAASIVRTALYIIKNSTEDWRAS